MNKVLTLEEKEEFGIKQDIPTEIVCQQCHKTQEQTKFENIYWVPYNEHGLLKYEGWVIVCRPCQEIIENTILSIGKAFS